jgi:hypothetical protein
VVSLGSFRLSLSQAPLRSRPGDHEQFLWWAPRGGDASKSAIYSLLFRSRRRVSRANRHSSYISTARPGRESVSSTTFLSLGLSLPIASSPTTSMAATCCSASVCLDILLPPNGARVPAAAGGGPDASNDTPNCQWIDRALVLLQLRTFVWHAFRFWKNYFRGRFSQFPSNEGNLFAGHINDVDKGLQSFTSLLGFLVVMVECWKEAIDASTMSSLRTKIFSSAALMLIPPPPRAYVWQPIRCVIRTLSSSGCADYTCIVMDNSPEEKAAPCRSPGKAR